MYTYILVHRTFVRDSCREKNGKWTREIVSRKRRDGSDDDMYNSSVTRRGEEFPPCDPRSVSYEREISGQNMARTR